MTTTPPPAPPASAPPFARIRPLRPDEAPALAAFAARLFRETYAPTHDAAHLAAHVAEAFAPARLATELAEADAPTLVVEDARGAWLAFAQLRAAPLPTDATVAPALEVARFYVDAPWHGRGVAAALMDAVLAVARERAVPRVWLQVWEENHRALAFYARRGFRPVGTRAFDFAGTIEYDPVLALELT